MMMDQQLHCLSGDVSQKRPVPDVMYGRHPNGSTMPPAMQTDAGLWGGEGPQSGGPPVVGAVQVMTTVYPGGQQPQTSAAYSYQQQQQLAANANGRTGGNGVYPTHDASGRMLSSPSYGPDVGGPHRHSKAPSSAGGGYPSAAYGMPQPGPYQYANVQPRQHPLYAAQPPQQQTPMGAAMGAAAAVATATATAVAFDHQQQQQQAAYQQQHQQQMQMRYGGGGMLNPSSGDYMLMPNDGASVYHPQHQQQQYPPQYAGSRAVFPGSTQPVAASSPYAAHMMPSGGGATRAALPPQYPGGGARATSYGAPQAAARGVRNLQYQPLGVSPQYVVNPHYTPSSSAASLGVQQPLRSVVMPPSNANNATSTYGGAGPVTSRPQYGVTPQPAQPYDMPMPGGPSECAGAFGGSASEARLTMPLRDGMLIAPFGLEHNLSVSDHQFDIRPDVFGSLSTNTDLELQLKCFHRDDVDQQNNWPVAGGNNSGGPPTQANNAASVSVQISVNGIAVPLSVRHRPLHIKRYCKPGRNNLQITVFQCCCSHYFLLHVVSRPPISLVARRIAAKQTLPTTMAVDKIRQYFHRHNATQAARMDQGSPIKMESEGVSLLCPFSRRRMDVPARSRLCAHLGCFDLAAFLLVNADKPVWQCPQCERPIVMDDLEVDQYMQQILSRLQQTPATARLTEVIVDASGAYRLPPDRPAQQHNSYSRNNGQQQMQQQMTMIKPEPAIKHEQNAVYSPAPYLLDANEPPPLKRVKSESVTSPPQQQANGSGYAWVNSQPPATTAGAASVGSPHTVMSPYGIKGYPATPATPSQMYMANPPSVGQPIPTAMPTGPLQQQSSIDSMSLAGSAPYTPASVGSAGSHHSYGSGNGGNGACPNTNNGVASNVASSAAAMTSSVGVAGPPELDVFGLDDIFGESASQTLLTDFELSQYLDETSTAPPSSSASNLPPPANSASSALSSSAIISPPSQPASSSPPSHNHTSKATTQHNNSASDCHGHNALSIDASASFPTSSPSQLRQALADGGGERLPSLDDESGAGNAGDELTTTLQTADNATGRQSSTTPPPYPREPEADSIDLSTDDIFATAF